MGFLDIVPLIIIVGFMGGFLCVIFKRYEEHKRRMRR